MKQEILLNVEQQLREGVLTEADFFVPNIQRKEEILRVGYELAFLAFQMTSKGISGRNKEHKEILQKSGFDKNRILSTINLDHYFASCDRFGEALGLEVRQKSETSVLNKLNFMKKSEFFELLAQGLYLLVGGISLVMGFTPWLNMLKFHAINDQTVMVVLDVLFVWVIIPITGFIVLIKATTGYFF